MVAASLCFVKLCSWLLLGRALTVWSSGEYASANNKQDDVLILRSLLGSRSDEAGETLSTAADLTYVSDTSFSNAGIISSREDKDLWRLMTLSSGLVVINVGVFEAPIGAGGNNLNVRLRLLDANLNQLGVDDPLDSFGASMSLVCHISEAKWQRHCLVFAIDSPNRNILH